MLYEVITDPRQVKAARLLERLSLAEANELARLGAPVLHSRTLQPLLASSQRLSLRCSYDPEGGATHILRKQALVKGARIVTSVEQVALIELKILPQVAYTEAVGEIAALLARHQLSPLTCHQQADRKLLRLAYTPETVSGAFALLQDS